MNDFLTAVCIFGGSLGLMAISCCCLYALQRRRERSKTISPESFPDQDLESTCNVTMAADSASDFSHESGVAPEEKAGGHKMHIRQVRYVVKLAPLEE